MNCATNKRLAWALLLVTIAAAGPQRLRAATCESLAKLKLPHATITSAAANTSGSFVLPPGGPVMPGVPKVLTGLPS